MSTADAERYSRQTRFAGLGAAGQQLIRNARVAIAGCGALGSVEAELLARAGTGYIRLIDRDFVEQSNLQRQFLFDEGDATEGLPKAVAGAKRLAQINSGVTTEPVVADLTPANAAELLGEVDLILDGTDNFATRYLINDFCVQHGVPWVYGAAVGSYGLKMAVVPGQTPCLRCVYPEPPSGAQPTCETAGVLGPVTTAIAALQAGEALRILAGRGREVDGAITAIDLWSGSVRQTRAVLRDPRCPSCGQRRFEYLEGARRAPVSLCGRNAVQIHERSRPLDLRTLAENLSAAGEVRNNGFAVRAWIENYELTVFPDGRAIIKGTTDVALARSLYARYVGA